MLTWFLFPKTKASINAIHIPGAQQRMEEGREPGRRTPLENMLSLFDEGGAVLLSCDETLLQLVRDCTTDAGVEVLACSVNAGVKAGAH